MLMGSILVKVTPHRTLNSRKFVIKCVELDNIDEEEIKNELEPQGIIAVKRISVRFSLYAMTIKGQDIPEKINIGYLKKETRPYIPNPQRCFQCYKFGHTKNSCKGKAVCAGCGEEGHNVDDCRNDPKCVNCQGDHHAISKDCPIWKQEQDIVTLKYKESISFADARKRVQPISDPSKNSYASVTQTPPQSARPLQPWARNIRPPTDFQTEVQFLKYILNYCLTRLDAIGNEQIPVNHTAATEDTVENTPTINTDDTTVLNNNTVASNDENNVDMAYVATSAIAMKRSVNDDSDEETRPNAKKMSAASSPASMRTDTYVSKEREEGDLPKISTFPSAPKSGEQRANGRSLSPIRPPSFTSGVPRGGVLTPIMKSPHHHRNPKKVILENHKYGSQLHYPVEL